MAAPTESFSKNFWSHTAEAPPNTPPLLGAHRSDVTVIGGGYTGLSTALHLAKNGINVRVLEAEQVGFGASGRNNGQVIPAYSRHNPDDIERILGKDAGRSLNAWVASSADLVFDLIRQYDIHCEAAQNGWLQPAHRQSRMKGVKKKQASWEAIGQPTRLLTGDETVQLTGSPIYCHGGWVHERGGHIQPLGYARGLARAAIAEGAKVHGASPAISVNRIEGYWRVETGAGHIDSDNLVFATNGYTEALWPKLRQTIVPFRTFHAATSPITDNIARSILPENHGFSDTRQALWAFRKDFGNRLITTAAPIVPLGAEGKINASTKTRLLKVFPQIGDIEIEYIWQGWIAMTPERLPRLHELARGVFAGMGYSGRGIAMATAMGKSIADRISGAPLDTIGPLPVPIKVLPMHDVISPLSRAMIGMYRWKDNRD